MHSPGCCEAETLEEENAALAAFSDRNAALEQEKATLRAGTPLLPVDCIAGRSESWLIGWPFRELADKLAAIELHRSPEWVSNRQPFSASSTPCSFSRDYLAFAAAQFPSGTVNCAKGEEIRYRFLNSRLRIW